MISLRTASRSFVALAVALCPSLAHGYDITMSSPTADSLWQANANLSVLGMLQWTVDPAKMIMEPAPDSCIVYIHAGGAYGVVTNSGNAAITNQVPPNPPNNTTGTEQYAANLNLTPAVPPIGGGNGANASYAIEAAGFFQGAEIYVNGVPLSKIRLILVRNG